MGRAVEAEDGLLDDVRSTGLERELGVELREAGTLRNVTSGASVNVGHTLFIDSFSSLVDLYPVVCEWIKWIE